MSNIICHLDCLGFKAKLKNSSINQIINILESTWNDCWREFEQNTFIEIRSFSDNICISFPIDWTESDLLFKLQYFFIALGNFQSELLRKRYLFRGAVVEGKIEYSKHFLVSPGFVDAYELEQSIRFPKIAISRELFDKIINIKGIANNPDLFIYFIIMDDLFNPFLDYHMCQLIQFLIPKKIAQRVELSIIGLTDHYFNLIKEHKITLMAGLSEVNSNTVTEQKSIIEKYQWAIEKHNHFIDEISSIVSHLRNHPSPMRPLWDDELTKLEKTFTNSRNLEILPINFQAFGFGGNS